MALMKWDPSLKKEPFDVPTSDDIKQTNGTVASDSSYFNNFFSQVYCKRVTVQNSSGDAPPVTRIEEAVFRYNPDPQGYTLNNQFKPQTYDHLFQRENFVNQGSSRKRSSHSSKHKSHHKSTSKKDAKAHKQKKKVKNLYPIIAAAGILVCPLFMWWLSALYTCQAKPLDFLGLESALKQDIFGQEDTLNSLMLNFYRNNLDSLPPVFLLSGSTGVGKSLIVDKIVNNFPGSGYKEMFFYPTPAPEEVVKKLKNCEHNLLIVDGLSFIDSHEIASWTERIQKEAVAQSKTLWLLLVFSTEHWTLDTTTTSSAQFLQEINKISNKIEEVFNNQGLATQLITFKPMEIHSVKECVRKELENLNFLADETQLDKIVRELTSTPSLRLKGCKHVKKYFLHSDNTVGLTKTVS